MANAVTTTISLSYDNAIGATASGAQNSKVTAVSAVAAAQLTQNVGTSEETMLKGDIGTIGTLYIQNNDATNFVYVYFVTANTASGFKLGAGRVACFPVGITTIYLKADTAACEVAIAACGV